jgi:hypothetical protein
LAELLGPCYLLMDEVARRDGYTPAERARFVARLPKRDRRALEAYRDGVHAFTTAITTDSARLPFEFGGRAAASLDGRRFGRRDDPGGSHVVGDHWIKSVRRDFIVPREWSWHLRDLCRNSRSVPRMDLELPFVTMTHRPQ